MPNKQDAQGPSSPKKAEDDDVVASGRSPRKPGDTPGWLVLFEGFGFIALAIGTILAIEGHLDRPATGATRSSKLQDEERQRLIDETIQAEVAHGTDSTQRELAVSDESVAIDGQ